LTPVKHEIYIDGKYLDERNAKVSVFDHGLLYGDGIFEGIRIYNGRVFSSRSTLTVCSIPPRRFCSTSRYRTPK